MTVHLEKHTEPIPGYRLIERIGRGGFGEVWKVEAPGGLLKAMKFVYGDIESHGKEGSLAEQELKALGRVKAVRHPYLLSLDRYDIIDGQLVIVMELADRNLWDRFQECRKQGLVGIPRQELLGYLAETAEGLDLMNLQYQLQHLDVKPHNLFLVFNHVKVADFGLVKILEGRGASLTWGVTPAYAAPETFEGQVSRYCDQYSLAIVYQELLTGFRPFNGTTARQLLLQHLTQAPNLAPLPPEDQDAIGRALAKSPGMRFATCGDLVNVLKKWSPSREAVNGSDVKGSLETPSDPDPRRVTQSVADLLLPLPEKPNLAATLPVKRSQAGTAASGKELPPTKPGLTLPRTPAPAQVRQGDGILFPALVIGLGHQGVTVLKKLREALHERFGSLQVVSNLSMLYLDTDPEAAAVAIQGERGLSLQNHEILLARLNRPSHYLKSGEGRSFIESWLDPQILYRIPRLPLTTGIRALGRLAFCDNHQLIRDHVREALTSCTTKEALDSAVEKTGLGLSSNRPRVYVVTGLSGGTGSGMFLDLAYLIRAELHQLGYESPELVGLFLLPGTEGNSASARGLGNAVAALRELNHFNSPEVTFFAKYDLREANFSDNSAPFHRCVFLQLPEKGSDEGLQEASGLAGSFLFRELVTPLGRRAEAQRAGLPTLADSFRGMSYQTFGMYRISWPRRTVIEAMTQRLCQRLLKSWMDKDPPALSEKIKSWVGEQWLQREFGPEHLISRCQVACQEALGRPPEDAFAEVTGPLPTPDRQAAIGGAAAQRMWDQLEQMVGKPFVDDQKPKSCLVKEALSRVAPDISAEWERKLAKLAVALIEQPDYRIAGAEEAIRQFSVILDQVIQNHEVLCQELASRSAEAWTAIHTQLEVLQGNSGWTGPKSAKGTLVELLRTYPKVRYQTLVLERVCMIYRGLLAKCPEFLLEISQCRDRLGDILRLLDKRDGPQFPEVDLGPGKQIFRFGFNKKEEAIDQLLATVLPEEFADLDRKIQEKIHHHFKALVRVLTDVRRLGKDFEEILHLEGRSFVENRLQGTNATDIFLSNFSDESHLQTNLGSLYENAAPKLKSRSASTPSQISMVAIPTGSGRDHLTEVIRKVLSGTLIVEGDIPTEIIFYREGLIILNDLPQLGNAGQAAYAQMVNVEHFTPHNRTDIGQWHTLGGQ